VNVRTDPSVIVAMVGAAAPAVGAAEKVQMPYYRPLEEG
jgi:hypothetical protein